MLMKNIILKNDRVNAHQHTNVILFPSLLLKIKSKRISEQFSLSDDVNLYKKTKRNEKHCLLLLFANFFFISMCMYLSADFYLV